MAHAFSLLLPSLLVAACGAAPPDPAAVADRAIRRVITEPYVGDFWAWNYGPAIIMSAMYEASAAFTGQDWTRSVGKRLDQFLANSSQPAYLFTHNETPPWTGAIGDVHGLMPIAFLSRYDFSRGNSSSVDWVLATAVADRWISQWPKRLPDGTFSRDAGWPGQPDVNASFLWSDDQFMGLALISRLAAHGAPNALLYLDLATRMQVTFSQHMQDASGLFFHGYDFANNVTSCCFWGRANGWVLMAHVEVLAALTAVQPGHPLFGTILAIFQRHVAGLAPLQDAADGRWHQVLNETSTYLETSATAMALYSIATGVTRGWLDRATYDPVVQRAWVAVASTVAANGTVQGICSGTSIMSNVAGYEARPTDYEKSQPGLGSVFRAALAYYAYSAGA